MPSRARVEGSGTWLTLVAHVHAVGSGAAETDD